MRSDCLNSCFDIVRDGKGLELLRDVAEISLNGFFLMALLIWMPLICSASNCQCYATPNALNMALKKALSGKGTDKK